MPAPNRRQKGQAGELLAKNLLQNKGYHFLAQNFRTRFGEIDLIFQHQNTIVFIEVKARKYFTQGLPEEAVTPRKISKICRVGEYYLLQQQLTHKPSRIDVIAVDLTTTPPTLRHHINVSQ